MKQLKFIAGIFLFLLFGTVSSQYYYFDSGGNVYQQGCSEELSVRINSNNESIRAGRFHLLLDPNSIIYPMGSDISTLRSFFVGNSSTFMNRSSDASPSWKSGSNQTILQADRSNSQTDYIGENGLYATIKFVPQYNVSGYYVQFGMEYFSGLDTTETTLSKAGGTELINPIQQNIYRTGTFQVLQEPCTPDTNSPVFSNFSINNNDTKILAKNGISFKLVDNVGVKGPGNVPYVWKNGLWTGNTEDRSNQYGINSGSFELNISCANCDNGNAKKVKITNINSSFTPNGKTWQDLDLNYDVVINSGELFDFGVEKTITITGVVFDRAGNRNTISRSFNKPVAPTLIQNLVSPKVNGKYINLDDAVILGIQDDWAGVDPSTIKITLQGINETTYGPYIFSGNDLELQGLSGSALTDDFKVIIRNHEKFPTSGTIKVLWEAKDNEGTRGYGNYTFSTRPDCSELQCCDPLEIWLERLDGNYEKIIRGGDDLIVTGSELVTGYIEGETGYINCNSENLGLTLYIRGEQTGGLYVDELGLLGKGVKGQLLGNELILSLKIDDITLIGDTPYSGQTLSGSDVNFSWHIDGIGDYDRISGYVVEIYSGGELYLSGVINGSDNMIWQKNLPDGDYEWDVYAYDEEGNKSARSDKIRFTVDTISPELNGNILVGGLGEICTTQTGFTITGSFSENVTGVKLLGENVNITEHNIQGTNVYEWNVVLIGGTGKVRLNNDEITDMVGNRLSGGNTYFVIGSYDKLSPDSVNLLTPDDGTVFDLRDISFTWSDVNEDNGCAGFSGYVFQISTENGGNFDNAIVESREHVLTGNSLTSVGFENGTYYWRVKSVDNYGNESVSEIRRFEVNSIAASCQISEQELCGLTGTVMISDAEGRVIKNIYGGSLSFASGLDGKQWTAMIDEKMIVSGLIIELENGTTGMCPNLSINNIDDEIIEFEKIESVGYECQSLTGKIIVHTGGSCGKLGLHMFSYNWNGLEFTGNEYVMTQNKTGVKVFDVIIRDKAGNTSGTSVVYEWMDTGVQLSITEYKLSGLLGLGEYEINTGLLDLFGAVEGDCGGENIVASLSACDGALANISEGKIKLNVNNDFEGEGKCEIIFADDDGNVEIGVIKFDVDTKSPIFTGDGLGLTGGLNGEDICTIQTGFDIVGVFSENVVGVNLGSLTGENVKILSINGTGNTYEWYVELLGGLGKVWLNSNGITDLAGNTLVGESSELVIGNYDNEAPTLLEKNDAIGYECQNISGNIVVSDGGCSLGGDLLYKWNNVIGGSEYSKYSNKADTMVVDVYVFDKVGNNIQEQVSYTWNDSPVTIDIDTIDFGVFDSDSYTIQKNHLIDLFGVRDGDCGTGTISFTGGMSSGANIIVNPENIVIDLDVDAKGTGYAEIVFTDDELNSITGRIEFGIKDKGVECEIVADRQSCGSGKVVLKLTGNGNYFSWTGWSNMITASELYMDVTTLDKTKFTGYVKNEYGQTGYCIYKSLSDILDIQGPVLQNKEYTGKQCSTISVSLNPIDLGCASSNSYMYSRSGADWISNNHYDYVQDDVRVKNIDVQIKDSLGNKTNEIITVKWEDVMPTARSFVLYANKGAVNWIDESKAQEGTCPKDRLTASVKRNGEKGDCRILGTSLNFVAKDADVMGADSCILTIKDEEGNTVDITVDVRDINKLPSVQLISPENGSLFNYGSAVDLAWTVVDSGVAKISGFIYEISGASNTTGYVSGYTVNTGVKGVVLAPGNYNWKISIVFEDKNYKIKSTEFKFHILASGAPVKDYCPEGDLSDSFYDGICDKRHGSATECVKNFESYSEELQKAYLYAYMKGITTQCPTTLDGYLYRDHFAKMISVYAINTVGRTPQYGKTGCDKFTDVYDDNIELQNFMKLSCELGLMGLNEDGVTPKTYFDPHSIVTRAEFGTVFSRLLFGDMYNVKNGPEVNHIEGYWYKKHLQALKDYGIMTKIDGDWPKYLERRGRVMLMMDRANDYGLFQGRIPAENGLDALFIQ